MDPLISTVRVTTPDNRHVARVSVRHRQFEVGRPLELDAASPRIAALEYALGAVGAEIVNGLRAAAWRRRLVIDDIEALVTGELQDALAYLEVIGETGSPRIGRIAVKLFVAAPGEQAVALLLDEVLGRLPLVGTFKAILPLDLDLIVTT